MPICCIRQIGVPLLPTSEFMIQYSIFPTFRSLHLNHHQMAKEYSNGEITVVWKPEVCIHSANCFNGLPSVFKPKDRPWIDMGGAFSDEIRAQVAKCPSGALSIKEGEAPVAQPQPTSIKVMADGPVRVSGPCEITLPNGSSEIREKDVFLCRCGHSTNKPYCDGSHKREGFKG